MKKLLSIIGIAGIVALSACEKQPQGSDLTELADKKSSRSESVLKLENVPGKLMGQKVLNFRAHLTGDQEVPSRETSATGQAVFQLSKDGLELRYKILVANLDNIRMAHIHVAPAGVNGPVVAWLYPPSPPASLIPGTTNGILQEGVITQAQLMGMLAGQELSDLIELITEGQTYVNIHTNQFPGGEIRGQIFGHVKKD